MNVEKLSVTLRFICHECGEEVDEVVKIQFLCPLCCARMTTRLCINCARKLAEDILKTINKQ